MRSALADDNTAQFDAAARAGLAVAPEYLECRGIASAASFQAGKISCAVSQRGAVVGNPRREHAAHGGV